MLIACVWVLARPCAEVQRRVGHRSHPGGAGTLKEKGRQYNAGADCPEKGVIYWKGRGAQEGREKLAGQYLK